jgi:GntR family transcriptional regulator
MAKQRTGSLGKSDYGRWIDSLLKSLPKHTGSGQPKHERLSSALRDIIYGRRVIAHDRLPPERVLAAGLGMSVGTVQKSLETLSQEGLIVRELGRGTFVSAHRLSFAGTWHFRFVRPGETEILPVRTTLVARRLIHRKGPWSEALGPDPEGYVRLTRRIMAGDEFMCFNRTWLPATSCRALLDVPAAEIAGENLRVTLGERFNLPLANAVQFVRADTLEPATCRQFGLPEGTTGLIMDVTGYTNGERPVFFASIATRPGPLSMVQSLLRAH